MLDGTWALINLVIPMGATVTLFGAAIILRAHQQYAAAADRNVSAMLTISGILAATALAYSVGMVLSGRA
ncbi:MAG: hypothetical protein J0J04_08555 [Microbacterium sp.]|uniref:hypothetical protein n=1 Tax=Microbacterium sp. TaxID=51671 RepID=UPI001AC2E850|nr:hypothetical protein [Microbacterium sp.]MBN9214827.1 hypothetical protein [Microbacterium sp.]